MIDTLITVLLSIQGIMYAAASLYLITEIEPIIYDKKENIRFLLGSLICAAASAIFFYPVFK